jgi:hypothetical protein
VVDPEDHLLTVPSQRFGEKAVERNRACKILAEWLLDSHSEVR